MLKYEYEWVKQARQILLDQCRELNENEFTKGLGFGFQSIRDSLVHVAGCYHAWIGSFILSKTTTPLLTKEQISKVSLDDIQHYFRQADEYVEAVIEQFGDTFYTEIEKEPAWKIGGVTVRKTPHQLLFHSITHEFHHKGQIVAMLRLLGLVPKNTDILGLPELMEDYTIH